MLHRLIISTTLREQVLFSPVLSKLWLNNFREVTQLKSGPIHNLTSRHSCVTGKGLSYGNNSSLHWDLIAGPVSQLSQIVTDTHPKQLIKRKD
jgi:hypothetical protein